MITRRTPRLALAAIFAILAATFVGVGSGSPAQAATATEIRAMAPSTYEEQLQTIINRERARRGLRKLTLETCTDHYSGRWSQHLSDTSSFYHQSLKPFFEQCGARYAAETIAWGVWTPRTTVTAWLRSTGHRRILLSTKPRRIGIGAVLSPEGHWVVTANFTRF